ncbi:hypothetical protein [Nitrospirillum bahiense]|uniref:hypothetical protein n=1 Tax=Nitrospirillum amazonense TaxID=28077 RepID=UPI0011A24921|nr:hypothetical protein [Nitrospirillum amazonense]
MATHQLSLRVLFNGAADEQEVQRAIDRIRDALPGAVVQLQGYSTAVSVSEFSEKDFQAVINSEMCPRHSRLDDLLDE